MPYWIKFGQIVNYVAKNFFTFMSCLLQFMLPKIFHHWF